MDGKSRTTNRASFGLRSLIAGVCTAAAIGFAAQCSALTFVGPAAFAGITPLTFEDLPAANDNAPIAVYHGVTFHGGTIQQLYADYGGGLVAAALTAGLGNNAATFGCMGTCGTGFTLPGAQPLVGFYLSSNVAITSVPISAYRSGVLLGTQLITVAADQIGFAGFADPGGIDQIVIGDNASCTGCIHQLDNVLFAPASLAAVPTMSQWGLIMLSGLVALGAVFARRRRHRSSALRY